MNHLTLSPALVGLSAEPSPWFCWPAPLRRSYCMFVAALTATKPFGHAFGAYCFCLTVSVMALTPSIVAPTNSRAGERHRRGGGR